MFETPDDKRNWLTFALLALFGVVMLGFGNMAVNKAVDVVVEADAERKARNWANFLTQAMPDLPGLIASGKPNGLQSMTVDQAVQVGDVFRFKLFNASAQLVLISDELGKPMEKGAMADHNGHAQMVLQSLMPQIDVHDGTQKENRPDLYVEAYVPVVDNNGSAIGVVEVYIDQTPVLMLFRTNFIFLAIVITGVLLASFGVPFVAYVLKMRQQIKTGRKVWLLSSRDQLTGLYNRTTFFQRAEESRQSGQLELQQAAVIYIDLDKFKAINDTFGHKAGDEFLRHVGNAISSHLTEDDLAARLGGDEFIFLSGKRNLPEVETLIESLRESVGVPVRIDGIALTGHLSLGVHFDTETDLTLKVRMHKADIALYQAKLLGRNTWTLFTPDLEEKVARRQHVEECIVAGLSLNRFEVHYQPLINPDNLKVAGFEALLRLKDADGNEIPPTEFIPIAEDAGEIIRIGAWVLEQAIQTASFWPEHLFVSVNLSTRQFDDGQLAKNIHRLLAENDLRSDRLELEVTENILIEDEAKVTDQLIALSSLGVSLAMDDFGTGYSSLGYLWKYQFNKLKVDRSFIRSLTNTDDKSRHILDAIIALGHRLDMTVTIEGIETEEQVDALDAFACDHLQGFYYGKPMPAAEIEPYFTKNSLLPLVSANAEPEQPEAKTSG
ncbi:MAG: bifunctional diguanylate cyclase/phosphodiesterase [Roseibium sp.]